MGGTHCPQPDRPPSTNLTYRPSPTQPHRDVSITVDDPNGIGSVKRDNAINHMALTDGERSAAGSCHGMHASACRHRHSTAAPVIP